MNLALFLWAGLATIVALICAFGWRHAHGCLVELCDVSEKDWLFTRDLLRQTVKPTDSHKAHK